MAYFADLTPHSYSPTGGLNVLNIGWLDEGHPFSVGPTSKEFQEALLELCTRPIILHRGYHGCWFCHANRQNKGGVVPTARDRSGNGQIRVLGNNELWYAAPTLVHHYVTHHGYSPPAEFVEAVLSPVAVATDYGWFPDPRRAQDRL